jgi:anti-anti-sigma regulatory factor
LRRHALSRAQQAPTDVVVDLSELVFADPSFLIDLAMLARRLRLQGFQILLRGAQPQIDRLIEMVGLLSQPGVAMST